MSTGERVCWTFTLVGAAMTLAPFIAEDALEPMGDARFAMAFVGLIVGLTAFVMVFFYHARGKHRARLMKGQGLLAQWTYTEDEWRSFAGEEYKRQAKDKRSLLWIVGVIMLIGGIISMIADPKAGPFICGVLFGVFILCAIAAKLSLRSHKKLAEGRELPTVRINRDALLLGDQLHIWRGWGARLEDCSVHEGPPMQLEINYSTQSGKSGRAFTSVRVPIPPGREDEAPRVLKQIMDPSS